MNKSDTPPNHDRKCIFYFTVNKDKHETEEPVLTGQQILEKTGFTPIECFLLVQSGHGQPREIQPDQPVDFRESGVERFRVMPRECTEGFSGRQDFRLPPEDEAFLDAMKLQWETVKADNVMRLIIYSFPVPKGYNHQTVDIYLRIEPSYPDTQIDMVYVSPALALSSGQKIGALASDSFDGRSWQRWSRHRTKAAAWQPGIDNVESHLALVSDWFMKEVLNG